MKTGFTLIEIMIAMFILTLGMVGVLSLLLTGSGIGVQSIDTTEASLLLDGVLTDLSANYFTKYYLSKGITKGYPALLEKENGGRIPSNPFNIKIPQGWAGTAGDVDYPEAPETISRNSTGLLKYGMSYIIYYSPLPNTENFLTNEPQCVLAEVIVYWIRQGRVFEMKGEQVVFIGNNFN